MSPSSEKVLLLRQLLAERFGPPRPLADVGFSTGLPALDELGIPPAALTEIVSSVTSCPGSSLLLYGLLHSTIKNGNRVILIDGKDSFAPKGLPASDLRRLLWTRCRQATEAIKAADLAIRDGNVPLVILFLTLNPASELRRIPSNVWHRLQMLAEKAAVTVLIFSPQAQVGCAHLRVTADGAFPLSRLHSCRHELLPALKLQVARRRIGRERRDDEDLRRSACA